MTRVAAIDVGNDAIKAIFGKWIPNLYPKCDCQMILRTGQLWILKILIEQNPLDGIHIQSSLPSTTIKQCHLSWGI